MEPMNPDIEFLWDMHEAAHLIIDFLQGMTYGQYAENRMVQAAVERQLEIMSAAARRITPDFHSTHPDIPWHSIIGLSSILFSGSGEVRPERIWLATRNSIPPLVTLLDTLIPSLKDDITR